MNAPYVGHSLHMDVSLPCLGSGLSYISHCALYLTLIQELSPPMNFHLPYVRLPLWIAIHSLLGIWPLIVGHLSSPSTSFPPCTTSTDVGFILSYPNNLRLDCSDREGKERKRKIASEEEGKATSCFLKYKKLVRHGMGNNPLQPVFKKPIWGLRVWTFILFTPIWVACRVFSHPYVFVHFICKTADLVVTDLAIESNSWEALPTSKSWQTAPPP